MSNPQNALTRRDSGALDIDRSTLQPGSLSEMEHVSDLLCKSQLFPGISTPAQAFAVCGIGRELGLGVTQALSMIHVIAPTNHPPKPVLAATAKLALVRRAGHHVWLSHDPRHPGTSSKTFAEWSSRRAGAPDDAVVRIAFGVEDAEAMQLLERWKTRRQSVTNMLVKRALTRLLDEEFGDVLFGLSSGDEIEDGPLPGSSTPVRPSPAEARIIEALQKRPDEPTPAPAPAPVVEAEVVPDPVPRPSDVSPAKEPAPASGKPEAPRDVAGEIALDECEQLRRKFEELLEGDEEEMSLAWQTLGLPEEIDADNASEMVRKMRILGNKAEALREVWLGNRDLREHDLKEVELGENRWAFTLGSLRAKGREARDRLKRATQS